MVAYLFTPLLVERTGRRIMLNISAVGVLICSAILGACLYVREQADHMQYMNGTTTTISPTSSDPTIAVVEQNKSVAYVAVIATVGYMGSYSLGYGPLPWVLISELIPLRARAAVGAHRRRRLLLDLHRLQRFVLGLRRIFTARNQRQNSGRNRILFRSRQISRQSQNQESS